MSSECPPSPLCPCITQHANPAPPCPPKPPQGRVVNFSNTVIIMTSNLGSEYLLQAAMSRPVSPADAGAATPPPGSLAAAKEAVMAMVRKFFRPELLNR